MLNALSDEEAERLKEMCGNDFRLRELIDKRGVSFRDDNVFEWALCKVVISLFPNCVVGRTLCLIGEYFPYLVL